MRIDRDGAIERHIAQFDDELNRLVVQGVGRSEHVMAIPFLGRSLWQASSDGKRITFVKPGRVAADSGTYRVISLNENGDTVFNKKFDMPEAVRNAGPKA